MNIRFFCLATILGVQVSVANAATVTPVFTQVGVDTTTAQSSSVLRADLSGSGLTEVLSITINDSNSGVGGSSGAYSGFDLDAVFLDRDGDYLTTADRIYASSFSFSPGTIRPGGPSSNTSGGLNGSNSDGSVNETFATLSAVDAIFFSTGSLTLGDGGSLDVGFSSPVSVSPGLFLFVSEVGNNGESLTGLVTVTDELPTDTGGPTDPGPSVVPVPAGAPLFLSALALLGILRRRGD